MGGSESTERADPSFEKATEIAMKRSLEDTAAAVVPSSKRRREEPTPRSQDIQTYVARPWPFPQFVIQPDDAHIATVILLHGLGDNARYWEPYISAIRQSTVFKGIRWLSLKAPERKVWGHRMNAWFEYYTDRSGEDREDNINERHLAEMRDLLHSVIQDEANKLKYLGGARRVMLVGMSQGGSAAFDAALTWEGIEPLAGAALLRSLPLGATAPAVAHKTRDGDCRRKVLVISGGNDKTFLLSLVRRNISKFRGLAHIRQEVVPGLNHNVNYDERERVHTATFISSCLGLRDERERVHAATFISSCLGLGIIDAASPTAALPDDEKTPYNKDWADLNEAQRTWAKQLGVKDANAWDSGRASVWYASWRRLSHFQRCAAERLGYNAHSWDTDE